MKMKNDLHQRMEAQKHRLAKRLEERKALMDQWTEAGFNLDDFDPPRRPIREQPKSEPQLPVKKWKRDVINPRAGLDQETINILNSLGKKREKTYTAPTAGVPILGYKVSGTRNVVKSLVNRTI